MKIRRNVRVTPHTVGGIIAASAAICTMVLGIPGCPSTTPECTTSAECDDGIFCNGVETCVDGQCAPGESPCASDQTCDEANDTCVAEPSPFTTNRFFDEFDTIHDRHRSAVPNCTTCHHAEPVDAGFHACSQCHSLDPAELNSYKEMAHDQNESGDGCRSCHESNVTIDGAWDCSFCHPV